MTEQRKLWERRQEDGDVELRVNGKTTLAHWSILRRVPYFAEQAISDGAPLFLTLTDKDMDMDILEQILEYIYLDNCFTDIKESSQISDLCYYLKNHYLSQWSLKTVMSAMNSSTAIDAYRVGHAFCLTPLKRRAWRLAIENGQSLAALEMLRFSWDPNTLINKDSQTALHISIEKGFVSQAKMLIENGADINLKDEQSKCALGLAAWYGYTDLVDCLLRIGADIKTQDLWQQTPLHKASSMGNSKTVELLLRYGANINQTSRTGCTSLHMAAMGGHNDVVDILLRHGAAWDMCDAEWHRTALHMAAWKGHVELVKKLVVLYGDRLKSDVGRGCVTPLHAAVQYDHMDVVNALLEHNVNINAKDWEGRTALHHAALKGNARLVQILLDAGATVKTQDKYTKTCLHLAAAKNRSGAVQKLIAHQDCPINAIDCDGFTALHYAASNGNSLMVRQLLKAGAKPTVTNKDGFTARNLAGQHGCIATIKVLIMARA